MNYALAFVASFGFIFLKALQQRNVAFDNYLWVIPTSFAMAAAEVYVISNIARNGYQLLLILTIGGGSGCGALTAMLLHKRFIK